MIEALSSERLLDLVAGQLKQEEAVVGQSDGRIAADASSVQEPTAKTTAQVTTSRGFARSVPISSTCR